MQRRISSDGGATWGPTHTLLPETPQAGVFIRQPLDRAAQRAAAAADLLLRAHPRRKVGRQPRLQRGDDLRRRRTDAGAKSTVPDSTGYVHMNIGRLSDGTLVALFRSRWADAIYRSLSDRRRPELDSAAAHRTAQQQLLDPVRRPARRSPGPGVQPVQRRRRHRAATVALRRDRRRRHRRQSRPRSGRHRADAVRLPGAPRSGARPAPR